MDQNKKGCLKCGWKWSYDQTPIEENGVNYCPVCDHTIMYRFTIIIVFNDGCFHQTQETAKDSIDAINKVFKDYKLYSIDKQVVSVTIAEMKQIEVY